MCAGVTTFSALQASGAKPGDVVAVHGIGGLGHIGTCTTVRMQASGIPFYSLFPFALLPCHLAVFTGIQLANKMGFKVVALSSDPSKGELAHKLGAHHFIETTNADKAMQELLKIGYEKNSKIPFFLLSSSCC